MVDALIDWLARDYQYGTCSPSKKSASPRYSTDFESRTTPTPLSTPIKTEDVKAEPIEDSDFTIIAKGKRKRGTPLMKYRSTEPASSPGPSSVDIIEILSDSDMDEIVPIKKPKGRIRISRQLSCDELITITKLPTCWAVPETGHCVAYLLDLTDDKREWRDAQGELLSMAGIIKSQVCEVLVPYVIDESQDLIMTRTKTPGLAERRARLKNQQPCLRWMVWNVSVQIMNAKAYITAIN